MMTESQILLTLNQVHQFLVTENHLLKTRKTKEALSLNEQKEHMSLCYEKAKEALLNMRSFSPEFKSHVLEKNQAISKLTEENLEYIEYIMTAHRGVMDVVADRVNEKNRPSMLYAANARAKNMNKHMPPSVAFNERL